MIKVILFFTRYGLQAHRNIYFAILALLDEISLGSARFRNRSSLNMKESKNKSWARIIY